MEENQQQPVPPTQQSTVPSKKPYKVILLILLFIIYSIGAFYSGSLLQHFQSDKKIVDLQDKIKQQDAMLNALANTSPTPNLAVTDTIQSETALWKTYTYKNMSFKYPLDWKVVFDSKVVNQPNGFTLHAKREDVKGYQPDGFYLSTFDDGSNYRTSPEKTFIKTEVNGDDRIRFKEGDVTIFSSCSFYAQNQTTIDICNQILSTLKFTED